ncbi:MAG: NAD(P)/FAD-dependent oxidoreductase [Steroidobacteraceae bacterium]
MARLTRRTFIGSAAVASLGASAGVRAAADGKRQARTARADVLVIGAGLSGLSSAMLLEEAGLDVQVIEARDRIGGRVFTRFDLPGYPEVGGNSFAAGYGRILDVARRLKVPVVDYAARMAKFRKSELVMHGRVVSPDAWPSSPYNSLPKAVRDRMPWELEYRELADKNPLTAPEQWRSAIGRPYDVSMYEFMRTRGVDDEVIRLAFSENPYFGSSAYDVSALMYLFNSTWIAGLTKIGPGIFSIAGGNQKLPMAMAASLKRPVELGCEVVAIATSDAGVQVHVADGSRYEASRVICSLPYSVVRNIRFDPVLAGPHADAVASLPYMMNTLIFLKPIRPFWEEDGLSPAMWTDGMLGSVMSQHFGVAEEEVTCLVVNPRGRKAAYVDRLPREEVVSRVIAEYESIRPAARGALQFTGYHAWTQDPYAGGDWAIYGPGQVTRFGDAIAAVHGRVHFCGEHTAVANRGMEGAMESAERVAVEVLSAL